MRKLPANDPEFAKRLNENELSKDLNDINSTMNSSFMRDQLFEINAQRMFRANQGFNLSYKVTLIMQIIMAMCMVVGFVYKFSSTVAGVIVSPGSSQYMRSGCLTVLAAALLGIVSTVLANKMFKKSFCRIMYGCMAVYVLVGIASLFRFWDDMGMVVGLMISALGVLGLFMTNKTRDAIEELDYLVTQEGFPTFNSAMFTMHRSRYVRLREKWEQHTHNVTGYSEAEKPTENIIVTAPEVPGMMDGISADDSSCEEWFSNNQARTAEIKAGTAGEHDMDGLAHGNEEDDFYVDQADPLIKKVL